MSLAKLTLPQMTVEQRRKLIKQNTVSPLVLVQPFREIQAYTSIVEIPEPTKIQVLDQEMKSNGFPNYNHLAYIAISRQYQKDSSSMTDSEIPLICVL